MWAPFPAALAMLLMSAPLFCSSSTALLTLPPSLASILYLKYRMRGLPYALGFAIISALLFINTISTSPRVISNIVTLVRVLFPCVILWDIYSTATQVQASPARTMQFSCVCVCMFNFLCSFIAPASDQKLMLLVALSILCLLADAT